MSSVAVDVVTGALTEVHDRFAALDDGSVADYIPPLAHADRSCFGLALVSMDGHRYQAGDASVPFTIQSVSKPFVYALVLSELGLDEVTRWVGAEPSGEAFNAISLEPGTGRPANPMVNAGAIVTTGLVPSSRRTGRFDRILACLGAFAGRDLDVDETVFAAEVATGDRNRALAYLMRGAGSLPGDLSDVVETYFRQCAVRVTAADLAAMAATLANGGTNPMTGAAVVSEPVAVSVLAVMATCGMYEGAGDWLLRVGLMAKSGVSGGLIAASPARFGLAAYSPPLDSVGNSVRGVAALRELSRRFGLHLMHSPARVAATVTASGTVREYGSRRRRSAAERAALERHADRIVIVAAQGGLDFTAAERLLYALGHDVGPQAGWVVVDLAGVTDVEAVARAMMGAALAGLAGAGHRVALVIPPDMDMDLGATAADPVRRFPSRVAAVAWCEDELLAELATGPTRRAYGS